MSSTASLPIETQKSKDVNRNKIEEHEARIVQLEALLKHFADGIITSPAVHSEALKESGSSPSAIQTNGVLQSKPTNLADAIKSPISSTSSENGEHSSNDAGTEEPKASAIPSSSATTNADTSNSGEQNPSKIDRARVVYRSWDNATREWIDKDLQPPIKTKNDDTKIERAFTYRKILTDNGSTVDSAEIDIEDTALNDRIKEVVLQVYPPNYYKTWPNVPFKIKLPFDIIVHAYDKFDEFASATEGDSEDLKHHKEDVRLLLDYVKNTSELVEYFKMRKESPSTIAFRYLWTLFPPGIEVVARPFFNQWQLFRTDYEPQSTPDDLDQRQKQWDLEVWCFDWTGNDWVKVFHNIEIEEYERDREISSLPCHPLKYYKDSDGLTPEQFRASAVKAGNEFMSFCELQGAARMVEYNDLAITVGKTRTDNLFMSDDMSYRSTPSSKVNIKRPKIKDRIIVDAESWYQQFNVLYLGDSKPTAIYMPDEDLNDEEVPTRPYDDWVAFCPPRFFGMALKTKTMAQFKVSLAKRITKKDAEPFHTELQLGEDEKEMLLALVEQQDSRSKTAKADIVEDKGRSLVILLHGPPGVGKTLTAETIAMATGKPLFVVSVAEVGLEAEGAEAKLEKVFDLASKWDAILLVDEADVFLESRSELTTPDRNALVSVLLRVLEYYSGTIMLTTNRITSLDPAVQSRIHLAIRYEELTADQRKKVFANFLEKAGITGEESEDLEKWFKDEASRKKLNGREVRNLVSSAQSLAKHKGRKLDRNHLRTVLNMTDEFKTQLQEQTSEWKVQNQGPSRRRG